jgi:hypothetical protein
MINQRPVADSSFTLVGTTYPAQTELQVNTLMGVDDGGQSSPIQHDHVALTE